MSEQEFERRIRKAALEYNNPGATPREQIWSAVDEARRTRRGVRPTARRLSWRREGLAAAAILILGVALGRLSLGSAHPAAPEPVVSAGRGENPYRTAAITHLRDAEEFLLFFRGDAAAGIVERQAANDARDLLSSTRLFLDMSELDDAELVDLLSDLETVLAQITRYTGDRDADEIEFIRDGIQQTDILPRLRSLLPTDDYTGTTGAL